MPFINRNFLFAAAVIVGMTVGAGIFGLPYVVSRSGIAPALFYFVFLGAITLLLNLLFGEIVLRTEGKHRLIGYAEKYLGRWGKILVTISTMVGFGTLLAYIILGGSFLNFLFSALLGTDVFYFSLIFWAALSLFVFLGIKFIAPLEFFSNAAFFAIIAAVFLFALPKVSLDNFIWADTANIFLPYGVILFAFAGLAAIPEVGELLRTREERVQYKKIIIFSAALIFLIYILFAFSVTGVTGMRTTPDALAGLVGRLGPGIILAGSLAALITLADSFLVIGLYLRNTLIYDLHFPKLLAPVLVASAPLALYLAGLRGFIEIIGLVGAAAMAIDGAAVILIFNKAKILGDREPEYSIQIPKILPYALIIIFIFGAIAEIVYFLKPAIQNILINS